MVEKYLSIGWSSAWAREAGPSRLHKSTGSTSRRTSKSKMANGLSSRKWPRATANSAQQTSSNCRMERVNSSLWWVCQLLQEACNIACWRLVMHAGLVEISGTRKRQHLTGALTIKGLVEKKLTKQCLGAVPPEIHNVLCAEVGADSICFKRLPSQLRLGNNEAGSSSMHESSGDSHLLLTPVPRKIGQMSVEDSMQAALMEELNIFCKQKQRMTLAPWLGTHGRILGGNQNNLEQLLIKTASSLKNCLEQF